MHETTERVQAQVQERFGRIATAPEQEQRFPVGPESAKRLGYKPQEIDRLPQSVTESFCGVGCPLALGEVHPGETVLDLGCGAGLDCFLAAQRVGPAGTVVGVDMTEKMINKARSHATALGLENVMFFLGRVEGLPLADETVDVTIANGVFNLCVDKPKALAETYRVLKPGGRLLMADILLEEQVTPEEVARLGSWSD
jgi:SAM-dependent methyltransferase